METTESKYRVALPYFSNFNALQEKKRNCSWKPKEQRQERELSKLATSKEQETFSYFEGYITHRFKDAQTHLKAKAAWRKEYDLSPISIAETQQNAL